jgi:hypothetical protein
MPDPDRLREYNQAWDDGRTRASYEGWLEAEVKRLLSENARLHIAFTEQRETLKRLTPLKPAFDEEQR